MTVAKKVLRFYRRRVGSTWGRAPFWRAHLWQGTGRLENIRREVLQMDLKPGREEWSEEGSMDGQPDSRGHAGGSTEFTCTGKLVPWLRKGPCSGSVSAVDLRSA